MCVGLCISEWVRVRSTSLFLHRAHCHDSYCAKGTCEYWQRACVCLPSFVAAVFYYSLSQEGKAKRGLVVFDPLNPNFHKRTNHFFFRSICLPCCCSLVFVFSCMTESSEEKRDRCRQRAMHDEACARALRRPEQGQKKQTSKWRKKSTLEEWEGRSDLTDREAARDEGRQKKAGASAACTKHLFFSFGVDVSAKEIPTR